MTEFVHLHNHTHYSLLDAAPTPEELVDTALNYGQRAVALTDHGVMFGIMQFYQYAKKKGIKPLIGMEAYIANGSRFDKLIPKGSKKRNYFHLIIIAKDMQGYKNLLKLTSLGYTEGFYYKPRIDKELLEKYKDGLILSSACIGGVINAPIIDGDLKRAYDEARYYKDLFGDDFYIEIQNHGLEKDKAVLQWAPKIAGELDIKLVATNDIHYVKQEHAIAHNVLLLIQNTNASNSGTADITKLKYGTPELYFKSTEQMIEIFDEFPDAIKNTVEIADKCELELELWNYHMPEFPIPTHTKASTLNEYLEELVFKGLEEKYTEISGEIKQRAEYELKIIEDMGFPGYFLIVWDFIRAAKERNVRVGPGRGSAAGSIVAYALGITNVDPLKYDLLFERFLNPNRQTMPDIDIDFNDEKREIVINYVKEKYGDSAVAQIITFGTLSSRQAITDIGRVLGVPLSTVREITKKIPKVRGKVTKMKDALELPELKWLKETEDEKLQNLVKFALILEDKVRNKSTHAAGIVIAPGEISDYVPVYHPDRTRKQSVEIASQFSMNELEAAGLLKMDFLGLRTLSIIDNTLAMIEKNHGKKLDIEAIDFDDEATYNLISAGKTLAIFQFESSGMQDYLKKLQPRNLEELTAMNALYRPGPMDNIPEFIDRKFGRKPISYLHPIMEKSLKTTYGIIVYQEQVMQLVQQIAGFTLGEADILRRAMGKKKQELMDAQKPHFLEGAAKNDIDKKLANEIYDLIVKFASYGFNKSHSLAYSYLAYQTAWLKTHYTTEFLAACMTAKIRKQENIVDLIDDAKYFDIKLKPPDINISRADFTAGDKEIYFGMAGIRNVGINAVENIVAAREEKQFENLFDFTSRVDTRLINKRTLEALICSGAFDNINKNRAALLAACDSAIDYSKNQSNVAKNIDSLFGEAKEASTQFPELPEIDEWSENERLQKEKEFLNFYISGHPLHNYIPYIESLSNVRLNNFKHIEDGERVRICALIKDIRTRLDRNNNTIAFVMVEDLKDKAECIFWNDSYSTNRNLIIEDTVVFIEGIAKVETDSLQIVVERLLSPGEAAFSLAGGFKIFLDKSREDSIRRLHKMQETLVNNSNREIKILFQIYDGNENKPGDAYLAYKVNMNMDFATVRKLTEIFGNKNVHFLLN